MSMSNINSFINNTLTTKEEIIENEFNSSFESEISSTNNINDEEEEEMLSERIKNFAKSISNIINELIDSNSKNENENKNDIFETKGIPDISLYEYLIRIISYSNCEENTLILSLIYIDKIAKIKQLNKFNIYKIVFTSILISLKFYEDEIFPNSYYSQIAGVSEKELIIMEYDFCILLNFNLFIKEEIFNTFKKALEKMID
jgi:hypothetical protein